MNTKLIVYQKHFKYDFILNLSVTGYSFDEYFTVYESLNNALRVWKKCNLDPFYTISL